MERWKSKISTYLNFNKWDYLVAAMLLGVVVARYPVDSLRGWFEVCFRMGCGFLFSYYLYTEINKWAGLLLLFGVLSHVIPNYTSESKDALYALMLGLGFYVLIIKKCTNMNILIGMIAVVAVIQSIFLIFQSFGVDPYKFFFRYMSCSGQVEGLMANRNEASAFLAITAPAFFRKKWWWFLLLILPGIYCAKGFGGYLGFCAALLCYSMLCLSDYINYHLADGDMDFC